jgi:hypothetical protein
MHSLVLHSSIYGVIIVHKWSTAMAGLQQPLAGFSTDSAPNLANKEVQARLSRSAVPAFFKLVNAWKVRDEAARQLLGGS